MSSPPPSITLAFTGASGLQYGLRLLDCLLVAGANIYLVYSPTAQIVAKQELGESWPSRALDAERYFAERFHAATGQLKVFGHDDWLAPVASGSNPGHAMVVCPCSMGTLAAIAAGLADNLIERAADVMLKENKKLILVPRETPLSSIHLDNMLKLSRSGVTILPPSPAFYTLPQTVADMVDFVVARILDQLAIAHSLHPRWGDHRLTPAIPERPA